jgi:mono/diheme cytochrome c family protein
MRKISAFVAVVALAGGAGVNANQRSDAGASPPKRTVQDGLYSAAQADRGREAYTKACAPCHMADLGGHEYAGALAGYPFQMKWEDASVAELFGRVRTMPLGEPGSLTTQEYVDITAYILQANGYPAGGDDLTVALAAQRWPRIPIERQR